MELLKSFWCGLLLKAILVFIFVGKKLTKNSNAITRTFQAFRTAALGSFISDAVILKVINPRIVSREKFIPARDQVKGVSKLKSAILSNPGFALTANVDRAAYCILTFPGNLWQKDHGNCTVSI